MALIRTIGKTSVNDFYYNQLDQYGKIIYDAIKNNKENMKTGTYKIDFGRQFNDLLHEENGEQILNTAFQSAWNAVINICSPFSSCNKSLN